MIAKGRSKQHPFEYPYEVLSPTEEEALCQEILVEVHSGQFRPAGEPSRSHWDHVWDEAHLGVPPYLKPSKVLRLNGKFIRTKGDYVEVRWYERFRSGLVQRYFWEVPTLYEFGCGNGWNLEAAWRHRAPLAAPLQLVGLDWAKSAVDRLPHPIHGRVFDFFHPDYDLKLDPACGVWTVGALEQTGKDWEAFLSYLLINKPAICVHVEPVMEWYDPKNPVDQTAIQYHLARNYWQGFPARMEELAKQGKLEILEQKRSYFGSKYIEGYSLFVWRPI